MPITVVTSPEAKVSVAAQRHSRLLTGAISTRLPK